MPEPNEMEPEPEQERRLSMHGCFETVYLSTVRRRRRESPSLGQCFPGNASAFPPDFSIWMSASTSRCTMP